MGAGLKKWVVFCALASSFLCLFAGIWILSHIGFKKDDYLTSGIGLYFLGKAFFAGPLLITAAGKK